MAVRKFKPTTPGQRHKVIGVFKDTITASTPEKSLTVGKRSTGGRNSSGHLSTRYRGGGHKRKLRLIDFKRINDNVPAKVMSIEYDPNRSARIALLYYTDGQKAYMIAPQGLQVGQTVVSGPDVAPEVGNCLPLANIPVGTLIHCIELRPGQGASMARSAGSLSLPRVKVITRLSNYLQEKLARCFSLAALLSALSVTPTTLSKAAVKPAALVGSAVALTTVVSL